MTNPCALFTSCCELFPSNDLIKRIKKTDNLEDGINRIENIWQYEWHIDTKYYTADIHLCSTSDKTIGDVDFADRVQAVIIFFNPKQVSSFEKVQSWLPYLNELSPSVQMLVCETCSDDYEVKRSTVHEWCIENEFELIELSPLHQENEEDDFGETNGVNRIIQALHAHTWSNLQMKDNPTIYSPYMRKLMDQEKADTNDSDNSGDPSDQGHEGQPGKTTAENSGESTMLGACGDCKQMNEKQNINSKQAEKSQKTKSDRIDDLIQHDDKTLFDMVGQDDPGGSFESMFAQFSLMKEKAENLPPEERKAYAEKIAISFWKALGGEDEEIDGLDSSGDEQ